MTLYRLVYVFSCTRGIFVYVLTRVKKAGLAVRHHGGRTSIFYEGDDVRPIMRNKTSVCVVVILSWKLCYLCARVFERASERESECVCVCVCERERERVCVCVCTYMCKRKS